MTLPQLDGRQHEVVYLAASGHSLIHGTAGSGKTVMAILRSAALAAATTKNCGPTLLLTHDNSLVKYLRYMAEGEAAGVVIETYHRFARGYLNSRGLMSHDCISDDMERDVRIAIGIVRQRYKPHTFFERPVEFFLDEIKWICGMGIGDEQSYLAVERAGRKEALIPSLRKVMWRIHQETLNQLAASGKRYYWENLATAVLAALAEDGTLRRYRHIVIDEAQDFSPEIVRSLAAAVQPGGSLTVFMDESQQVYGQRTTWRTWGLYAKPAQVHRFTDNYRNTAEIARIALAMAEMPHFKDTPDIVMPITPRRAAGALPTLYVAESLENETATVVQRALSLGRTARVAVLVRKSSAVRSLLGLLPGAIKIDRNMQRWDDEPGIYVGTFHAAKGLEFEIVIVPFANADSMPRQDVVTAFGAVEARGRESRLLYVGVTRARTELLVTCTGSPTQLLPSPESGLWQVEVKQ